MLKGKNLIDLDEFTTDEIDEIIQLSQKIARNPDEYHGIAKGKILAALFYEPSTRTRLSFEAAMLRLGGQVIGFSNPSASSVSKGESLSDTLRTVNAYADIIAMRHPKEGAPRVGAKYIDIPIINAGDGGHQHPTQTLTDILTITSVKKRLSGLTIGLCGDLKFGRTVHSLIKTLSRYPENKFILVSPQELKIPQYIKSQVLQKKNIEFAEAEKLEDVIQDMDILYMTRVQRERFFNEEDYIRLKDSYILDKQKMSLAKDDMIVLHPLPRVNEIAYEVDEDSRALYFDQVKYGMYVRMGLMAKLLGVK
ncbi:aspartate carbamoyltransferase [Peptoclostridium litorale DSM 5388]|uniref:Aspartate carbamoyltransferase n=1 Tax=Peptoclostridium litorale DSM 5388 TaxID=1121324 RepID=A0A069RG97_PEPLI|nr:aspartate carbamoyltransferase [Peptoclostridium litorale]KDR96059.1 aspartate carbamoyltransferase PyrB [Peptoclostridium litorale DSM 5388]SIO05618.1 aspartate carbamoyltransferase [Peptoclostridium litorale DSM 5388]